MMTNTIQTAPSSSSCSSPRRNYDVFLSFHGKDTRKNFTAHLYKSLTRGGIFAFRDDEELERGEYISEKLLKAIEESKFAIVVLSRNYASSRWCLIELAKIVECMEKTGLTVLPAFYHVDPSHVRNQAGSFADAFTEHEKNSRTSREVMQTWKTALQKLGSIAGWDLRDRDESKVIEEIVEEIHAKLNSTFLTVSKKLVGIDSRLEELMNLYLNIRPDDVRFLGIWGMGGIGKTTLARAVYDKISSRFEVSCFIANVREKSGGNGLADLQNQLLSDLFKDKSSDIKDVDIGKNKIRHRLRHRRVLVVVDDVDQTQQLEALAIERDWFGRGSLIIITTRDTSLFIERGLAEDEIYRAKQLDDDEALQLFSWKAFKNDLPLEGFVELSRQIIHYANGLPLALEVLGLFLCGKNVNSWKDALGRLKENPKKEIVDTLKISFDALEANEQNIFLDVACFFKGWNYADDVKSILESCNYHPSSGIEILISKALITIMGGELGMHDLLQEMGHEIVRRQSRGDPGKQTRLWLTNDIIRVLKNNSGTNRIEGIVLSSPPKEELHLNSEVFSKMKNLRLLRIKGNVHISQGLSYLSTELRVIQWCGYPSNSLPMSFRSPNKLVMLAICCSHIVKLWKGIESLYKLEYVDLHNSQYLLETPDFTNAPNIKKLILRGCTKLRNLHSSVGALKRLIFLDLEGCTSLTSLPCNISWDSLEILILSGCTRLRKFPKTMGNMNCLRQLEFDRNAVVELPSSIGHLIGLTSLSLRGCKSLLSLPSAICDLTSLKTLDLSDCSKLEKMPEGLGKLEHLEELNMNETAIRQFPSSITRLRNLKMLSFRGSSGPPKSFLNLFVTCLLGNPDTGLVLPTSFSSTQWSLNKLNLSYCHLMDGAIPDDLSGLSSLLALDLSGNDFTFLPESISKLPKLSFIFLGHCSKLRSIQELPSRIVCVEAEGCISLETRSDKIHTLVSDETGLAFLCGTRKPSRSKEGQHDRLLNERRTIQANIDLARVTWGGSRGGGIPMWFQNQSMGSSITIRLQPDLDDGRKWLGFALYFFYEIHDLESWESTRFDCEDLVFYFVTDEGPLKASLSYGYKVSDTIDTPAGHWIYVPRNWLEKISNEVNTWSYITVSITIGSPFMKVERCGAHLIYEQNAHEFIDAVLSSKKMTLKICDGKGNFKFQSSSRSSYPGGSRISFLGVARPRNVGEVESSGSNLLDKGFTSNEMLECTSENSISTCSTEHPGCNIDSDSTNRLKSLLLRCYEVNYAKRKMHKYVFPISASPLWFTVHGMGPVVSVDLPPNLYDDKGWVGFAVSVSYVIRDQTSVSRNIFGHLDAYDDDLECFFVFPSTPDTIVAGPSRIFLFHLPRVFFTDKLNQRRKIRASFVTDDQNMEVVMCGIRLVYKKDLIGLVHTIVDCVLRSPEIHLQSYLRSFENQVNNLPNYVYDEAVSSECNPILIPREWPPGSFCYFSTERRNQYFEMLPSSSEEQINYYLFEKCLTQIIVARDSKDSNSNHIIQAGAAYLNELSKGDPAKASHVNLVLNHLQDTHINKFHPYNNCFLQCEIPDYFCCQACHVGSSVAFRLPQNLNKNYDWIGIALCVVFTINKNNEPLIHDNPAGSEISYTLLCHLTRNTSLEMLISHGITTRSGNNSFIWLLYIPRDASFSESLNECDHIHALFYSSSPDLIGQKCGHKFVYLDNMAELVGTIAQCAATSPHNSGLINHQFEGDDQDRSNRQCRINDQEETSKSDSSDDEISRGTRIKGKSGSHLSKLNQKIIKCINFLHNLRKEFHFFFASDHCFPPSETPEFLTYLGIGPSVTMELPTNMHNDSAWVGLLICASFTFQENQIEFLESLESEIPHHLICFFDTDIHSLRPIHVYRTAKQEFKWLHFLNGFIWLSYIPIWWLPNGIQCCNHIEVSIMSDWPGWIVNNCGLRFLSSQDLGDFMQLLLPFQVSFFDNWGLFQKEILEQDSTQLEPFSNQTDQGCTSIDSGFASDVESHPTLAKNQVYILETSTIFLKRKLGTLFSTLFEGLQNDYHGYFFPQGEMPPWFNNRNDGPSIEIQLPSNLYNDKSWMGFAICAILGRPADSRNNSNPKTPAGCILHLDSNEGCLKPDLVLSIPRSKLLNSDQLLVVHYVSPTILPSKLNQWSHVKAIVECNIPSVETQMCGIRLMYKQDVEGFVQTTAECAVAIPNGQLCYYYLSFVDKLKFLKTRDNRTKFKERNFYACHSPIIESRRFQSLPKPPSICKRDVHQECSSSKTFSNERVSKSTASGNGAEIVLPPGYLDCTSDSVFSLKTDFEYFLQKGVTTKVPEWFNHQSRGPLVNIQLPPNIMNDRNWMGLALCATYSIHDDQYPTDLSRENPNSNVSHKLFCGLVTDLGVLMPPNVISLTKEKCMWLYLRGFLWLAYIPRRFLRDGLYNLCSEIKAFFGSNCPKLTVQSCSLRLLYRQDMEEFDQTFLKCYTPPYQYQNREVFHRNFEYSSCFLPCGITEWFNYHSNEPSVGFELPPDFYNDNNWLGLAMCASFWVYEDD
ncbi:uncharacterized protein LOC122295976 isoform X3 [Carya illinoinensis]|uniref:uncharacterized protein LOC122295976 isoform X3 n=1 Tax=Carya illinoinensis TaxID=32201 RepID=UPI001C72664A|nr:uncharacterized protein LOC122295976 isoform X3 [Carya illinoinensis]